METQSPHSSKPPRLLDQVRGKLRLLHYSKRTEDSAADTGLFQLQG